MHTQAINAQRALHGLRMSNAATGRQNVQATNPSGTPICDNFDIRTDSKSAA
jgi:hypothetical protein